MKRNKYIKIFAAVLLCYSIIMAAICISFDVVNTLKYGAIDLRNRVVGARLLLKGEDPYYFKWNNDTPEYYVDARDFFKDLPVSRLTVPPTFLLLHAPFAGIPYKTQQILWAIFQWMMLIFMIVIFSKITDSDIRSKIIWIIGLLLIAGSFFWRLYIEKGQVYILFAFLIVLAYWISKKDFKYNLLIAGIILGFTLSLRPPVILMSIPFLIYRKWKVIVGGIIGIIIGIASSFITADFSIWQNYFSAMKIHELFHLGIIQSSISLHPNFNMIEGVKNSVISGNLPMIDSSFQELFRRYLNVQVHSNILWISLIIVILLFSIFLFRKRKQDVSIEMIFFIGLTLVFLSEFFLPAARLSYNNVIWLPLLSFVIIIPKDLKKLLNFSLIFLFSAFLFNSLYRIFFKFILLADFCMLLYVIIMMFYLFKKEAD
ncbi:MAG: DUF2029 domain-containing protein [Candidatus Cloacimonetes bacterium]|nr:DUF2029 domain-containing protein [Candidatus Cloacimonadota bacterium]MBL7148635.1 DUF2029 domain-containing protein [Candidatus Cloacimonadota bacterium]